jgi:hypothetical protein
MAKVNRSHHVVPAMNGGWSVVKYGADRASKHFATKKEAEIWGRSRSIKERSTLFIHRHDGTVAQEASYGDDPHPPLHRK